MFNEIDLRALAERQGPERAFLSLYLSSSDGLGMLDQRSRLIRSLLADNSTELEYFEENLRLVQDYLEGYTFTGNGLCVFACWALDYVEAHTLEKPVRDLLWVDSSPYVRPLAELQDEYETFVVVAADNDRTRLYLVTSAVAEEAGLVRGDIKNNVKVGGWSQKRYQRRRDDALHHYAADVAAALADLAGHESFNRIVLVGSDEAMREIEAALPGPLAEKVVGKESVDLKQGNQVWEGAYALFFEEERAEEESLWERIKNECLRGGRGATGPADVLTAAALGRVERMIVTRDAKMAGTRCRDCENLGAGSPETCPICGSADVFKVDLINELVELLATTSAEAEFADPIPGLSEAGDVAALLRY